MPERVLIESRAIEWFHLDGNRTAQLARGTGSTLLMLALLAAAGSAVWVRTRSVMLPVFAGLWCGSTGILILLSFALTLTSPLKHMLKWGFTGHSWRVA